MSRYIAIVQSIAPNVDDLQLQHLLLRSIACLETSTEGYVFCLNSMIICFKTTKVSFLKKQAKNLLSIFTMHFKHKLFWVENISEKNAENLVVFG